MSQDSQPHKDKHNAFQDVIPHGKRSIRDIPIPENRKRIKSGDEESHEFHVRAVREVENAKLEDKIEELESEAEAPAYSKRRMRKFEHIPDGHFSNVGKPKHMKTLMMISGIGILLVILLVIFSSAGGAHLKIYPRQEKTPVEATMSAKKNPLESELGYEIIAISKQVSEPAVATGEQNVSRKATGVIIIYNNFSTANQTLIKNTRFESPDGLIYRIADQIVVPGQKTISGKLVPGSVEAKVTADEAGEKYNSAGANFTIPGFKGDPRFDKFYAKTKSPITGGFIGKEKLVAEADLKIVKDKLQAQLKDELTRQIRTDLPPTFILYENGIVINYESLPNTATDENNVLVTEKGTLSAIAFDREAFAKFIAKTKGANTDTSFSGIENLSFDLVSTSPFDPLTSAEVTFKIKGDGQIVWGYDQAKLKQELVGKNKKELTSILAHYPNIERAEAVLKPFWTHSFPDTVDKITIENIIGE